MAAIDSAIEIHPFHIDTPEEALDDLRRRIEATRWPTEELVAAQPRTDVVLSGRR